MSGYGFEWAGGVYEADDVDEEVGGGVGVDVDGVVFAEGNGDGVGGVFAGGVVEGADGGALLAVGPYGEVSVVCGVYGGDGDGCGGGVLWHGVCQLG